jgi:hypothetical protein
VLCSRDKEGKVDPVAKETLVSQVRLPLSELSRLDPEKGCCREYDLSKLKKGNFEKGRSVQFKREQVIASPSLLIKC